MFESIQRYIPLDSEGTNAAIIWVTALGLVLSFILSFTVLALNARKNHLAKVSSDAKDLAIANAHKDAAKAIEGAAYANVRAADANSQASKANERAAESERISLQLRVDLQMETSNSRAKQIELEREQQKTAIAQRETARAQLELKNYVNVMARYSGPRTTNDERFKSFLKRARPQKVQIYYQEGSSETYLYASALQSMFIVTGWEVESPNPLPITSMVGLGGGTGLREVVLAARYTERSETEGTTEWAVWKAITSLERGCGQWKDETLPEELYRIYVGPSVGPMLFPLE